MIKEVSVYEARNNFSRLLKDVQAGDTIIISNRGEPVAEISKAKRAPLTAQRDFRQWLASEPEPPQGGPTDEELLAALAAERDSWN